MNAQNNARLAHAINSQSFTCLVISHKITRLSGRCGRWVTDKIGVSATRFYQGQ